MRQDRGVPSGPGPDLTEVVRCLQAGDVVGASARLAEVAARHPGHPRVLCNQGRIAFRLGQSDEAMSLWHASLAADPGLVAAMVDLSSALLLHGELRSALAWSRRAVTADTADADLWANLSQVLNRLDEPEALIAARHGLEIDPRHARCLHEQLVALHRHGPAEAVVPAAERILAAGGGEATLALAMLALHAAERSDWDVLAGLPSRLAVAASAPQASASPVALLCLLDDPGLVDVVARNRARALPPPALAPAVRPGRDRLTVGYLSPDLGEHPVAHMLLEVLPVHDRRQLRILACALRPDDGSDAASAIRRSCDGWIDLAGLDDVEALAALRAAGIDVLVDLAGSTHGCRPTLLAQRPAPVQLLWLGCPTTTGARHYDGFLVDVVAAPPGYERHCSEPLVRLPCCYHPIGTGLAEPQPATRASLGLPEDGVIVGLVQDRRKILPQWACAVARMLGPHPTAQLLLRLHPHGAARALEMLAEAGLPSARVHALPWFAQRVDYLAVCRSLDLAVDSHPFGGHSTVGELLSLGVPVLSLAGRSLHARVGASMLNEFGLDDLVARDADTLGGRLADLLRDPAALAGVRNRCAAAAAEYRRSGIVRLARALEVAYAGAVARISS